MKTVKLGSTDLHVSQVCLGTMTWGQQNTQPQAFEQMNYAVDQGINFFDTAELYPVPPKQKTQGATEIIIGNWFKQTPSNRDKIILATKTTGVGISWIRDGAKITSETIKQAIDDSLKRLQTDYIDLYQLHWPNRMSPHFSKHWPGQIKYSLIDAQEQRDGMLDILQALDESVKAGKIKHCGLSDDTPWGINEYLQLSKEHNLPKMVSIQNEFSLLHLKDSPYLIENCVLNDVAYLPWSPMAGGALSGKYRNGEKPANCRWTLVQRNGIFRDTTNSHEAIEAYHQVAEKHGMSIAQLSLAWVFQFDGVTSTIIGATSMKQLKENIAAYKIVLNEDVLADINTVIRQYPVPF